MSDVKLLELPEVLALLDKATPGLWRWSMNGNIVPDPYSDDCEIAAVYSEHMDDTGTPVNADAIIAAVNYLRAHGANLAERDREVAYLKGQLLIQCSEAHKAEARAERLAGALRDLLDVGDKFTGDQDEDAATWVAADDAARAALEQENDRE